MDKISKVLHFQKLRGPDLVEKVLSSCPVARSDPTALAMLQDPQLFLALTNPDNLSTYVVLYFFTTLTVPVVNTTYRTCSEHHLILQVS